MTKTKKKTKNPLEPVASVVSALFTLAMLLTGVGVLMAVFAKGSFLGIGSETVCAETTNFAGGVNYPPVQAGVSATSTGVRLCDWNPGTTKRILGVLGELPKFLLSVGALFLANRLIKDAGETGVYSARMANRLRVLGWVLLAGSLVTMAVDGVVRAHLIAKLLGDVARVEATFGLIYWDLPETTVLIGLVVLTFARVTRVGARMREDLEGTV